MSSFLSKAIGIVGFPIYPAYRVITVMLYRTRKMKQVTEAGEMLLYANRLFTIDRYTFDLKWETFKGQKRAMISLTDCASIAVFRVNGIFNVATFDEEFKRTEELSVIGI